MNKRFIKIAIIALAIALPISAFAEFNNPSENPPEGNTPGSVWLNPSSAQVGSVSVSGNVSTASGDFSVSTGKAIRVDASGNSVLNVSNWGTDATGFTMKVTGNLTISNFGTLTGTLTVPQICLNGTCRTTWPTGSSVTDQWVNETGDSMTGKLSISASEDEGLYVFADQRVAEFVRAGGGEYVYLASGTTAGVFQGQGTGISVHGGANGLDATGTRIGVSGSGGSMGGYFDKKGNPDNNVYLAANGAAVDAVHSTYGVRGSGGSIGVYGISGDGYGVEGESTRGYGVHGYSDSGTGVSGYSVSGNGVSGYGSSELGYGVMGVGGMAGGLFSDSDTPLILTRIGSSSYSIDGDGAMNIDGNTTLGGNLTVDDATMLKGPVTVINTVQPQLTIDNDGGADSPTLRFVKDGTWAMDLMSTGGNAYLDIPASGSLYIRNGDTGGDIARFGLAGANLYVNTTLGGTLTTGYGVTVGTVLQVLNAGTQLKQVGIGGASNPSYPLYNYGATWLDQSLNVNGKATVTDQMWVTYTGSGSSMVVDNTQTASDTVIKLRNGSVDKGTYQVTNAGDTYVTMPSTKSFYIANSGVDNKTTYCKIKPADAATWSCSSDRRLKKDISGLTVGLDAIMQLKPSTYTWKESGTRSAGFIAQDVQSVLPSLVSTNSDDPNGYLSISEPGMIPYMVKAIQDLKGENDSLKEKVSDLEARLNKIEESLR